MSSNLPDHFQGHYLLSYASSVREMAPRLAALLQASGTSVCLDHAHIQNATSWRQEL